MATHPATIAPPEQPATDPNAEAYDAIRRADAAGDADAVARLSLYLKQQHAPAPITDSGTTMGFAQDAPAEASRQLSPEDSATFYKMLRGDGAPKATAAELRHFVGSKGLSLDNAEQIVEQRDKGQGVVGEITYPLPKVENTDGPAATAARGAMDTITFGTLPKLGAGIAGIESAIKGDGFLDKYHEMLDHNNGVIASDQAEHPYYRVAGQLLAGLAIPTGLEGVGFKAGSAALREGATLQEARGIAMAAVRNRMALTGGAYGAAHGAGSADNIPDAVKGAATEGALGATAGLAFGTAGQYIDPAIQASRAAARALPISDAQQTFAAADRQGIDLLPADVGGPVTRGLTAFTAQTPFGAGPIFKAASHLDAQAETRLAEIAGKEGNAAADIEGIGTAATEGGQKYVEIAKRAGGRMYDFAAQKAGDAKVDLQGTRDLVDQQIARLKAVPGGGAGLQDLETLRAALDKPATVQGVRDMRTEMFVDPQFRNTPVEGRMKAIANAASKDVEASLRGQGLSEAADAYKAADQNWRSMLVNLKRNVEPVIGKLDNLKSPEAVSTALNSAMKNNGARVGAFVNSLPNEQQNIVRASLLSPLGRDASGNFSINRFATDWSKISPAAKRAVFGNESRAALDDLATVGNGAKAAQKYANHSNTGRAIITERTLGTLATGGTIAAGIPAFLATAAAQHITGMLLASPKVARWIARAPKTQLSGPAYLDRLTRIARAEPAIANDVLQLQSRLSEMISSAPQRAAADPDKKGNQ